MTDASKLLQLSQDMSMFQVRFQGGVTGYVPIGPASVPCFTSDLPLPLMVERLERRLHTPLVMALLNGTIDGTLDAELVTEVESRLSQAGVDVQKRPQAPTGSSTASDSDLLLGCHALMALSSEEYNAESQPASSLQAMVSMICVAECQHAHASSLVLLCRMRSA